MEAVNRTIKVIANMVYTSLTMLALAWTAIACALVASGFAGWAAWTVTRSLPVELQTNLRVVQGNLDQVQAALEAQNGRLTAWRSEMEALYESVEGTLESVERKRRSTAAAASRLERTENGQAGPMEPGDDLAALARQARQMGFDV